jgi:hypothetical protein
MVFSKEKTPRVEFVCDKCKKWDPWDSAALCFFRFCCAVALVVLSCRIAVLDSHVGRMRTQLSAIGEAVVVAQSPEGRPLGYPGPPEGPPPGRGPGPSGPPGICIDNPSGGGCCEKKGGEDDLGPRGDEQPKENDTPKVPAFRYFNPDPELPIDNNIHYVACRDGKCEDVLETFAGNYIVYRCTSKTCKHSCATKTCENSLYWTVRFLNDGDIVYYTKSLEDDVAVLLKHGRDEEVFFWRCTKLRCVCVSHPNRPDVIKHENTVVARPDNPVWHS